MTIGDVFTKAWELWRRDVGWLILAGLVVGLIVGIIAVVVFAIVAGMLAVSIGGIAIGSNNSSTGLTGLGVGTLIGALLIGLIGYLIVSALLFVFYGGMFEMVIGAARENRGVVFGELFSGFRKFGTFMLYWLVLAGIGIVSVIVLIIPIIGWIAVPVFWIWLMTTWLYVLPLIADRGLSFGEAVKASSQMVKGVGWWRTFLTILVLLVAYAVVSGIIRLIGRASSPLYTLLSLVFEVVAGPFLICYVSTMYMQAGGEAAGVPAGGYAAPLAPPPASGYVTPPAAGYVAPPIGGYGAAPAAPPYQPAAPPPIVPAPAGAAGVTAATVAGAAGGSADADMWKAAADPLATAAPPSQLAPPAPLETASAPPADHEHTAATAEGPGVDAASGTLEKHCSQCGALIEGSDEFCQSCALEVSGGEPAAAPEPRAPEPRAPEPRAPEPRAPEPRAPEPRAPEPRAPEPPVPPGAGTN